MVHISVAQNVGSRLPDRSIAVDHRGTIMPYPLFEPAMHFGFKTSLLDCQKQTVHGSIEYPIISPFNRYHGR